MRVFLIVLFGCGPSYCPHEFPVEVPAPGGADEAEDVVKDIYTDHGLSFPPEMSGVWYQPTDSWPNGITYDGYPSRSYCVWGVAVLDRPLGQSALAHELMHCALAESFGNPDSQHNRADWALVEEAKDVLQEMNL